MPSGNLTEQLEQVELNYAAHFFNFAVALCIGPFITWMLVSYRNSFDENKTNIYKAGIFLYSLYLVLISLSYGSQISIFPWFLRSDDFNSAMRWFFYNDKSLAIWINQIGYLFWSFATIIMFARYMRNQNKSAIATVALLMVSSLMQIIASMGLIFGIQALTMLSFPSGLLLVPVGFLILFQAVRGYRDSSV